MAFYMMVVLQAQLCILPQTRKAPDYVLGMQASLIMFTMILYVFTLDSALKGGLLLNHQQLAVENAQGREVHSLAVRLTVPWNQQNYLKTLAHLLCSLVSFKDIDERIMRLKTIDTPTLELNSIMFNAVNILKFYLS